MSIKHGTKRGPYKPKQLKFEHTCIICNLKFKSADVKGKYCADCKLPRQCQCGCGTIVKTPGRILASGCSTRGKTYKEIYGTDTPGCGFKSGLSNPMYNEVLFKKSKKFLTTRFEYNGIKFRSQYEIEVFKTLERQFDEIIYESTLLINDKVYYPDFIIDNMIIEVSGYPSTLEAGRARMKEKIKNYLEFTDKFIILIVPKKYIVNYNDITNERLKIYEYESQNTIHYQKR